MADVIDIAPEQVVKPRALEIVISDTFVPGATFQEIANRLFIYTGTIRLDNTPSVSLDDNMHRWTIRLDISKLLGHHVFDDHPFHFIIVPDPAKPEERILKAATVASLATIGWDDNADHSTWAVDAAEAFAANDHLVLMVDLAIQGTACGLARIMHEGSRVRRCLS